MKHIKLFENFNINESNTTFENALEDWANSDFVKSITGKNELSYSTDYDVDSDDESTWVEIYGVNKEFIDLLDKDFEEALAPFEAWVRDEELDARPNILTSDDGSVSFVLENFNFGR